MPNIRKDHTKVCAICGTKYDSSIYYVRRSVSVRMRKECLCFRCAFWLNHFENRGSDTAVVDGKLYRITPCKKHPRRSKHVDQNYRFLYNPSTGKTLALQQCVLIAEIPQVFRDATPDEYRFVWADAYFKLRNFQSTHCRFKGCFDRYHCHFYHPEITEKDGPWNEIPEDYEIGGEECESFINKSKLYVLP